MTAAEESTIGSAPAEDAAVEPAQEYRPGERALTLLATPLNLHILRALTDRPMRLAELRRATGLPAQTTLRGHLGTLWQVGALTKRPTDEIPYTVENELTAMGRELLEVADLLEGWLRGAPDGPVALGSGAAKGIVKAFVDGWGSRMMRHLASGPISLTELDREIAGISYPSLERRLASMRMAGLIEARPSRGVGTPYAVTEWARRGFAPLAAAGRCERVHMGHRAPPVTEIDIEAVFLLATPLAGLSDGSSGVCQFEVKAARDRRPQAGVRVEVRAGEVVACDSELVPHPPSFAVGSTSTWISAVKDGKLDLLSFGGVGELAESLVSALHAAFIMGA